MAETDTRLETLEDEVKVLKGEVKRTLVDLRALLMREDSPLGEAAIAKRMAMQNPGPASEAPVTAGESVQPAVTDVPAPIPQPAAASAPVVPVPVSVDATVGLSSPAEDAAPESVEPAVLVDAPGPPPDAGPGHGPGVFPDSSSVPPAVTPPGPPPSNNPAAQVLSEPRLAEADDDEPPKKRRPRKPIRAEEDDEEEIVDSGDEAEDAEAEPVYQLEDEELDEVKPLPSRNGRSKLAEYHSDDEDDGTDAEEDEGTKSDSKGKSERVTSIYDEYRDLMEESKPVPPMEDGPVGPPLDVNLLSNLVYWAALAKQRVGEEQLKDILQLYIQSGHSRPELQDLLLHICNMVEGDPLDVDEGTSDWVDLMFHLHGILTGGFPVVKIPQIKLPVAVESEEEDDDY